MNSKTLNIVLGAVIVLLLAGLVYFARLNESKEPTSQTQNTTQNQTEQPAKTEETKDANDSQKDENVSSSSDIKLPAIAFIPDVFTEKEKNTLKANV